MQLVMNGAAPPAPEYSNGGAAPTAGTMLSMHSGGHPLRHVESVRPRSGWGAQPPAMPPDVPGYTLALRARAERLSLAISGAVLVPLWIALFSALVAVLGGRTSFAARLTPTSILLGSIIALIAVPVAHELLHGLAARAVGAHPTFGIGPGYAYTTFREPLGRWRYLAVGMTPFVAIGGAAVVLAATWDPVAGWLIVVAVVNAAGTIGDLWMTWRVLRLPRQALFCDLIDGFAALMPNPAAIAPGASDDGSDVS